MVNEKLVPKIRFSEFTENWEEKSLGDILSRRKKTQKISKDAPLLAFAAGQGVIDRSERKTNNRDFLTKDSENKTYLLTEYNDIVYNPSNLKYGAIDRNSHGKGVISPIYVTFVSNISPLFMEYIVKSHNFQQKALKYEEGTVIKRQSVHPNNLVKIKIKIPKTENERIKIANFLSLIDKKMELLEKKHNEYQKFKKYLMQQIFAQKLRFGNFTEEWELKKLGEIVEFLDNKRIPLNEDTRNNQKNIYPYYGASGIIDYVEDYIFDEELILIGEDGTIDVNLASGKYWVSNHAHVLKPNKDINQYYLYEFLKTVNFEIYNTGTIQPKLNKETCKTIPIKVPKSLDEQNLIANCLFETNNKISIYKNQIQLTKKFKKGLLQQMFV